MFNFRSPSFKQTGLNRDTLSDSSLIDMMLNEPRLVRRPVVRIRDNVYFGADTSALEKLLG
jgi:arsenate reductase-like glutaredoxin family protein